MHLILPRNDEKRIAHLDQLVEMATSDIESGKEYLPRELYNKLKALNQKFYDTYRTLGKCNGRKMTAVAARNKTTQRLCFLVRDVYVMARRKYERGDYGDAILAQHGIPKTTIRDTAQKGIWITLAEEILVGDKEYSLTHPTILRDPTREDLEAAKKAASAAHREFRQANTQLRAVQTEMQYLRKQATSLLISAKHAIVAGFFELKGAHIREVLFAYGYRFKSAPAKKEEGLIKLKPTSKPKPRRKRQVPQDHAFTYSPPIPKDPTPEPPAASNQTKDSQPQPTKSREQINRSQPESPKASERINHPQPKPPTTQKTPVQHDWETHPEQLTPEEEAFEKELREVMTVRPSATKPKAQKTTYQTSSHTPSTKADRAKKKKQRKMAKQSRKKN